MFGCYYFNSPSPSSTIQIDFQQVLNSKLDVLHANVDSFQLLDAELPTEFNAARAAQAAAFQDISVAQAQSAVAQDQARANVAVQLQNYQVCVAVWRGACVCMWLCVCVCACVGFIAGCVLFV